MSKNSKERLKTSKDTIFSIILLFFIFMLTISNLNQLNKTVQKQKAIDIMEEEIITLNNKLNIADSKIAESEYILSRTQFNFSLNLNKGDITEPSNIGLIEMRYVLKGTGLEGCEYAYLWAEKEYGINAIYLYALTAHESAYGRSRLAEDKNNVSGFRAYDNDPYNTASTFETKSESIIRTALVLHGNYISENRLSLEQINDKYATDTSWHLQIDSIAKKTINEIKEWRENV